ncbi:helix-turn-helix domain-containing protein [Kitasatospora sp. NBC_01266]|uniref:helix-turn-helix domain-containing protein n=1 Tax=Kitasatospora sp. NBC_01266 TaxID=2903572 RepID=UPI002E2F63F3|nr:helix-turn-helix transcriptional regulator [Kitasatospora sp. NBC_01266]
MAGRKNELDPTASPGCLFGGMLRMYRELRQLSQPQLAAQVPCDDSLISRIESGTRPPKDGLAARCDEILDTGGALAFLMPYVRKRLEVTFTEGFLEYLEEEATATELKIFHIAYIPGLLQTPACARALLTAGGVQRDDDLDTVEQRLAVRIDRQQIITSDAPPFVFVVIDESALRRPVGGRQVMRELCDHLLATAARPNVALQVAPMSLGERAPLTAPLTLLTLPDGAVAAYTESLRRGSLSRDPAVVESCQRGYALLQIAALSQDASADLIRNIRQELYS